MNRFKLLSGGLAASLLVLVAASAVAQSLESPPAGQWWSTGRTYDLQRYSSLSQINRTTVKNLKASWTFSTGVLNGHEGNPLVINNVMYVHSAFPNIVYALDLTKPGAPMIWKHVPSQPAEAKPIACCDLVNRGLAYHSSGKLFIELLAGDLLALDAKTGKQIWRVPHADYKTGSGVRGRVSGFDVNTGQKKWTMYSTGPDAEVGIEGNANENYASHRGKDLGVSTWQGDEWQRGGGTTWGWYSYDPELNLFYYGSGNPGSWNPDQRPGDNKWSMTIWARNPETGKVKWAYQMTPHDEWDYDGVNEMVLADLTIGGRPVKALVHFDRNGFGYTLDRTNGKVLVAEPFGPVNWASKIDLTTGVPVRNATYGTTSKKNTEGICPAAIGFKDQQPSAFSPQTKLFYVPTNNICMDYEGVEVKYSAGQPYVGAIVRMYPGPGGNRGRFIAWDPTVGRVKWEIKENLAAYGGALATAGGVVFYGTMEGWLKAVDATTGTELWKFKCPSGIIGNPMTYLGPDGKQYVAVLSGVGGWAGAGIALGITPDDPTAALGAIGAFGDYTNISNAGGTLLVFGL